MLYVNDTLLIGNDILELKSVRAWLSKCFWMKDLREASYILGIRIYIDRSKRMFGLSQSTYINKVLKRFKIKESERGCLPMTHVVWLSED